MTNPIHLTQDRMTEGRHNEAPALQPIPDARMLLFTQLKPYTSQLLRARDSPARLQGLLRSLQSVIRDADVDSLNSRGIFDYILFPLMPGVDSIVLVRRSGVKPASSNLPYPAAQSDAVAEAMLECCVALMQRCPVHSGEQLSELLERFVAVASLDKASAAEEVRLKAVQCMLAMLSTKPVSSGSALGPSAALRDPSRAPMLGFMFSTLLKAAEEEVQAGLTGSQALAATALEAIRYLSQAVNSGDALAFVVPGLASGMSKILIAAGSSSSRRPSGSRVGSATAGEALRAFTCLVTTTLGDSHAQQHAVAEQALSAHLSAEEALNALQKLALQQQEPAAGPAEEAAGVTTLLEGCSVVLGGASEVLYEVLFTLAQDDWPQVSSHCQTWLASWLPQHPQAVDAGVLPEQSATGDCSAEAELVVRLTQEALCAACVQPGAAVSWQGFKGKAVPGIVERLLLGLVPALRSGEEPATLHARRLTTALQACSQQQLTTLLLNSPVSAASWAPTLCCCFAFERSAAALLMYNTSQPGPHRALAPPKLTPSTPLKHPSSNTQPQATCQTAQALDTCGPQQSLGDAPASSMPSGSMARQGLETSAGGSAGRTQAGMGTTQTGTTQTGTTQAGETQVGRSQASRTHEGRTHSVQPVSATAGASDESADPVEMGSVVLPRMPLGLSHITTDTAYTAVAGVARALGKCSMAAAPYPSTRSGSAVLHGITQHLLQIFEAQVPAQAAQNSPYSGSRISSRGSEQNAAASPGWQGKAASAVVALSEVVFGASSAWQGMRQQHSQQKNSQQQNSQQHRQQQQQQHHQQTPHISSVHSDKGKDQAAAAAATEDLVPAPAGGNDSSSQRTQPSSQPAEPSIAPTAQQGGRSWSGSRQTCDVHNNSGSSAAQTALHDDSGALEPIVVQALDEFSNAGVWSLATHLDADAAVPGNDSLTPQVLGGNALLIRAMLEAVGVFARVLGPPFASRGVIMRKVLLVLLERLADPCPSVASSAAAALGAVCLHCGYPSRRALLAANADYLVDGLCCQLRSLDSHPRAPYLFAAVLQQAGAGPQLLPLLADPARAAFQGLSITARHNRAFHIHPFLQVLMHIVAICEAEAAALLAATRDIADHIKAALAATQPQSEDSQEEESESSAGTSRIDAVRAFFEEHHRRKANAAAAANDAAVDDRSFDPGITVLEEVSSRRSQIHSVAVLAHASAEVATPLLLSASLKVGLLALKVGHGALRALHSTTAALDLYEQVISPVTSKQEGVRPPPDTPQLLPSIHVLWGALTGALKDSRRALVQGALQCLVGISQLGGLQFMTRRLQTEAWPVLQHLLTHGVPQQPDPGYSSGPGSQTAPAALQQMRHSVLQCIDQLASIGTGRSIWKGMTDKVAEAVALYLDNTQTCAVKEAAAQALLSVAKDDPDTVWMVLHLLLGAHELDGKTNPNPVLFPDACRLLQTQGTSSASAGVDDLRLFVSNLLRKIETIPASWQSHCVD